MQSVPYTFVLIIEKNFQVVRVPFNVKVLSNWSLGTADKVCVICVLGNKEKVEQCLGIETDTPEFVRLFLSPEPLGTHSQLQAQTGQWLKH